MTNNLLVALKRTTQVMSAEAALLAPSCLGSVS
jgi:hypothetical protein